MFDIICGNCGESMKKSDENNQYLICERCENKINGDFINVFFDKKYSQIIKCIKITGESSAIIYFK